MKRFYCQPGDILFYFKSPNLETRLIQIGEDLEEGETAIWPYHVAVALTAYVKVEANGKKTDIVPIDYGKFRLCRPPYDPAKINQALGWARTQAGRLYGWIGIADQALRDLSLGKLHLPRGLVQWSDSHWPYCSTLATDTAVRAGFNEQMKKLGKQGLRRWPPNSPADMWKVMKQFEIDKQTALR